MKQILPLLFIFFVAFAAQAQSITNVQARQAGKVAVVTYDLTGPATETYQIELHLSDDNGNTWMGPLKTVRGDVGAGIRPGTGKKITWEALQDYEYITGNVRFKVKAKGNAVEPPKPVQTLPYEPEMVFVKGGIFTMGCTNEQGSDCGGNEKPAHRVQVSDFYIGKFEVTQDQWVAVMKDNPSSFKNCGKCPVESVSWDDVQYFIKRLNQVTGRNYRLPTEAEWEYAARGGAKSLGDKFSGGPSLNYVGWYKDNSSSKTQPVGGKEPNELGIYDMSGNVWEWCQDWYDQNYYVGRPSLDVNPQGAATGTYRVSRGGSWYFLAAFCRVADRYWYAPDYRSFYRGFRLALPSR
jgi:sulfatase modifying factor 1